MGDAVEQSAGERFGAEDLGPLCGYPRIRYGSYRRWDVLTALLATDREIALPSLRKIEHECQYRRTKSETAMLISPDQITDN
jgi:hypothetical protein